jgi:curved DNA-binding protein
MEFRDYYKILGVERSATADQIKTAYRRLARKYHPDVSKEANAEARFKEVQEAYEVLRDPEKRAAYDQLGSEWKSGQSFHPPPDWGSGFEFSGRPGGAGGGRRFYTGTGGGSGGAGEQDFSEFFSSLFGGGSPFRAAAGRAGGRDHHARVDITLEEAYRGTTRMLELKRPEVKPDGSVELHSHTVRVSIPPGVSEGQLIRLAGQGEPAAGGGNNAGDLYLEAHILPDRVFTLDNRDVTLTFPVAPWEAALGASVTVPTLGAPVEMRIPAGAQSGQKLRLRGRGLPGQPPGDQYVQLKVVLPPADSAQAKAIYEEMRSKLNFDPRA